MSLPRTSKEKSGRVDWGHFNRPAPTARMRTILWLLAAVTVAIPLCVVTVLAGVTGTRPAALDMVATRGPLTAAHAGLDMQCEACHEPFERISGGSWAGDLGLASQPGPTDSMAQNAKCQTCHAGAIHHPQMRADSPNAQACSGCHRDHQGRNFDLKRIADNNCVGCHGSLPDHANNPAAIRVATSVSNFATDHPEFRQLDPAKDVRERAIKFSHAVHMAPGLDMGEAGYTFERIVDPDDRKRYMALLGESDPTATVALTCASCHQLDASRTSETAAAAGTPLDRLEQFARLTGPVLTGLPKEPLQPPRQAGQIFLPINFEVHCRACHPLTFDESPGLSRESVPHRKQPPELEGYLRGVYSARYIADTLAARVEPDRGAERLDPLTDDEKAKARGEIDSQVAGAMQTLFGGNKTCLECHFAVLPKETTDTGNPPPYPTAVVPGRVPTVLQPRARFDHTSHRGMECRACHPNSYRSPDDEADAEEQYAQNGVKYPDHQHPPDLPSIETCRQCHAPARTEGGVTVAGVRHGCTDCHNYHHADRTLQGPGSPHNNPPRPLSLEQMLHGGRTP